MRPNYVGSSVKTGPLLHRLVARFDKHATHDYSQPRDPDNPEHAPPIDAATSASANWAAAKMNLTIATASGFFTGAAALDFMFSPLGKVLIGVKVISGLIMALAGTGTAAMLGAAIKNTGDAAVWATIAGTERMFGLNPKGAPLVESDDSDSATQVD